MNASLRSLYPSLEPDASGYLEVSHGHCLYWETCGVKDGHPVVVLHGGPGSGSAPAMRRFFNPKRWRVILFDQRGAGRSTPTGSLDANTTWDLVDDVETLRARLGVSQWAVFGGSWGSTLALAYAQRHRARVNGMVLRGVFLMTQSEIDWFYRGGAAVMLPDAWRDFLTPLTPQEREDPLSAYYTRLTSDDASTRRLAAAAWTGWEGAAMQALSGLSPARGRQWRTPGLQPTASSVSARTEALARIECHYCVHRGFLPEGFSLLDGVHVLQDIPCWIVQGALDLVTPPKAAWRLSKALPKAEFSLVPRAGHGAFEPPITDGLVRATDALAKHLARSVGA